MDQERVRERDREPEKESDYEVSLRADAQWMDRCMNGRVLIRADEREFQLSRMANSKQYLHQAYTDTALQEWTVWIQDIKRQSGRHRHQGGSLVIFALEGEGTTDVDGLRLDWKPGDLLLLPVKPKGVTHQHFNRDPQKGCRWLAFNYLPFNALVMFGLKQLETRSLDQSGGPATAALNLLGDASSHTHCGIDEPDAYQPLHIWEPSQLAQTDLLAELFRLRDHQRYLRGRSSWRIRGDDLPWQVTAQGLIRWYMHPAIEYTCVRMMLFYVQQIPPGSRSGRQRHGGNAVFFVLEGRGHTVLDGVTHRWAEGDLMTLPNRPDGVIYQHFNDDPDRAVKLVACEPNLAQTIDLDRGASFEQLEVCPEYRGGAATRSEAH